MKNRLHITNGGNSVSLLKAGGIKEPVFSWDDILHEGPVPAGESLAQLSEIRADYIVNLGFGDQAQILAKFTERDRKLLDSLNYSEVVLWFEHDLYDQLQLIQVLDWFNQQDELSLEVYLINPDRHLGHHYPEEVTALYKTRRLLDKKYFDLASIAWQAFTSSSPLHFNQLLAEDLSLLPFLSRALLRMAKEYPEDISGLPKTESMILECLDKPMDPKNLFKAYCRAEKDEFLGDSTFFAKLKMMASGSHPLVKISPHQSFNHPIDPQIQISKTDYADKVIAGKASWFKDNQHNKWIGGCLVDTENNWRWQQNSRQIIKVE